MAGEWSVLHFNFSFFDFWTTCPLLLWPKEAFQIKHRDYRLQFTNERRRPPGLGPSRRPFTPRYDILPFVLHRWRAISLNLFRSAQEQQSCVLCDWTSRGSWRVDGGEGGGATMIQLFRTTKTTKGRVDYYSSCNARRSQSQKEKATTLFLNPASPQDCVLFRNMVCFGCCDKAGSAIIIILILWWYFLFYWTFSC